MKRLYIFASLLLMLLPNLSEACSLYRDVILDNKGNILIGVSVTVTLVGSGASATLYSDNLCTVTIPNPTTSDSAGTFQFYVADGEFALAFVKTGYSFPHISDIAIYDPLGENVVTLAKYSTADIAATGTGAIAQIGATQVTLIINKAATASLDFTCPSTLTIIFLGQGTITLAAGKTATATACRIINLTEHAVLLGSGTWNVSAQSLGARLQSVTNAQLTATTAADGTVVYCTDCTINSATCAATSTGARATKINGAWRCD